VIEQLQGAPIPASVLETEVLSARLDPYRSADLDLLCAAGEILWCGIEATGDRDGRVALYLPDLFPVLAPLPRAVEDELPRRILEVLGGRGASFFADVQRELGSFAGDLEHALWALVWAGRVTNDTLAPLRSRIGRASGASRKGQIRHAPRRSRLSPPGTEGRWSLLPPRDRARETETALALAGQLLDRYGILTREAARAEGLPGGFASLYPVLKGMEESGRIRRGYFVEGMGAAQFARSGADDRLRHPDREARTVVLAATDPANLFGASLAWPEGPGPRRERSAGALVILRNGELAGFLGKGERELALFGEPADAAEIAAALAARVGEPGRRGLLIARINGDDASVSPHAAAFLTNGFTATRLGLLYRAAKSPEDA
jgi:ATP-dependent Lhr-like helicase